MRKFAFHMLTGFCTGALAACGSEDAPHTLVEAAETYASNEAVFESIRGAYPGPYEVFARIPARDPAEATPENEAFLEALRETVPVEHIDFFPIGGAGGDEIDVVLNRYNEGDHWITVSLVYFSTPVAIAGGLPNVRFFESCDGEALTWLSDEARHTPYSAFCRINDNWRAYQRVD